MNINPRILIVRPDRIGDVVLSTPLPREIKVAYPQSLVAVLLRKYTEAVYLNNPNVDEIIIYDQNVGGPALAARLRKYKFDYSLTLLPTERLNWVLFLAGIRKRIGVGHKFYQFLTNAKSVYRNKYIPLRHESDYCLDEIRKLGITPQSLDSEIFLTEKEQEEALKIKENLCPNGEKLIGINSTSGNSAPNLPKDEYKKLITRLLKYQVKIAVTDLNPPEELKNIQDVIYLSEGKALRENIVRFSALDLLISSSTGPMHIAAALKVRTLSLFCPLPACSPELWSPRGNESEFILPDNEYCQNKCPGDPKICEFQGKGGINADIIFERIKQTYNLR